MTLHWWMHWFWVTMQIVVTLTNPTTDKMTEETTTVLGATTSIPVVSSTASSEVQETTETLQQNYRIAKAIGVQPPSRTDADLESLRQTVTTDAPRSLQFAHITVSSVFDKTRTTSSPPDNRTSFENIENKGVAAQQQQQQQQQQPPGRIPGKKEGKITWIQAFGKPVKAKFEEKTSSISSIDVPPEELTVMPLQEFADPNAIRREESVQNRSIEESLLVDETVEPRAIATAASVLEAGLVDSTRLGRARGTFTSEFQRDQLSSREEEHTENKEETIKETAETSANVTEIATITGSCLAIIILLSTVGSLGFIMYRRKYLNPPQTLNSDKCSNPDSSGYIDDSTIRDNSEEMYSLDNDSFLNSLEAMTIQNYWTDSVKHTKL